ncbi:MAG TPA: protein kinase, partial [Parachlamydiaceae bacterium]|nr:protein kinase [Parachlamydiaceae bacterium]
FSHQIEDKKLVFSGREFKWMTQNEMQDKKQEIVADSLRDVALKLKNIEIKVNNGDRLENLLFNMNLINNKIIKHNNYIENNKFLKLIDVVFDFVTNGSFRLKYHSINNQIDICSKSIRENSEYRTSILKKYSENLELLLDSRELTETLIHSLYDDNSTREDLNYLKIICPHLRDGKDTVEEFINRKILWIDLTEAEETITEKSLENNPQYRSQILEMMKKLSLFHSFQFPQLTTAVIKSLQKDAQLTNKNAQLTNKDILHLTGLMMVPNIFTEDQKKMIKGFVQKIEIGQNIQKIKSFVSENSSLIKSGALGTRSKKDNSIIKFKANVHKIPHNISYNHKTGDVIIDYGEIGRGSYKIVKKKMMLLSNQMLAVGKQKISSDVIDRRFTEKEILIMQKLKGKPNVLQLHKASIYYSEKKGEVQRTFTEFCSMGELKGHMNVLTEKQKLKIAKDIIKGILEVHKEGIVHRDIKGQNIFLKEEIAENGEIEIVAVVGDFGVSCFAEYDSDINLICGTSLYMAPGIRLETCFEEFSPVTASFASDAWSVGVVLSELFGDKDFEKAKSYKDLVELFIKLKAAKEPSNKESMEYVIWKLLRTDVENRMKLEEALTIIEKL